MSEKAGFVTVTALVLLVLLGCVALSMSLQARSSLDIARNSRLYVREQAVADAVALKAAAMLLREKDAAVLAQHWLAHDDGLAVEKFLSLAEEQWSAKDVGLFPEAFVVCQLEGQSLSDSLDVSAGTVLDFHLFVRAKENPYAPVVHIGVRKIAN